MSNSIVGTSGITSFEGSATVGDISSRIRNCTTFPALFSAEVPATDIASWARYQKSPFRVLWTNRDRTDSIAASGIAAEVVGDTNESVQSVISRCRALLQDNAELRAFGGFSFQSNSQNNHQTEVAGNTVGANGSNVADESRSEWDGFGSAQFWLPRLTFDGKKISCVVLDPADKAAALEAVASLVHGPFEITEPLIPAWTTRENTPDKDGWTRNINKAIEMFRRELLEKIVLARKATFKFESPVNAIDLASRMASAAFGCYQYCFHLDEQTAFVGASPERLFRREANTLFTEAVAGTRPRSEDAVEDRRLADELLSSQKDQLEHQIVRKSIRQQLHRCLEPDSLSVSNKPKLMPLAKTQHLCSVVKATLHESVSDGQLIERLHPTPAVGGYPTGNALSEISRLEPFDRGWYAAPVGWISRDAAEFAVAIRSGLLRGDELSLYSGAGIVPGSDADEEWNEVEHKLVNFMNIIGS